MNYSGGWLRQHGAARGDRWHEFLIRMGGKGYTRVQLVQMYHKEYPDVRSKAPRSACAGLAEDVCENTERCKWFKGAVINGPIMKGYTRRAHCQRIRGPALKHVGQTAERVEAPLPQLPQLPQLPESHLAPARPRQAWRLPQLSQSRQMRQMRQMPEVPSDECCPRPENPTPQELQRCITRLKLPRKGRWTLEDWDKACNKGE
ncbi:MAG: hypothetical protein ACYCOU_01610 [Sulfobacillus sp.]